MNKKYYLLMIFSIIFLIFLNSCSSTKEISNIELTGKIYSLGNEPFIGLGIEDYDGTSYRIMKSSPTYDKLENEQGKYVSVIISTKKSEKWDYVYVISYKIIK